MAKKKTKATASTADPTLDAQPQAAASAGVTSRGAWRALDAGASILAAMAAPALTKVVWRSVTGKPRLRARAVQRSPWPKLSCGQLWPGPLRRSSELLRHEVRQPTGSTRPAASPRPRANSLNRFYFYTKKRGPGERSSPGPRFRLRRSVIAVATDQFALGLACQLTAMMYQETR